METKEQELKALAKQKFINKNYPAAFITILKLEENLAVNFLLEEEWFLEPTFCGYLSANYDLLTRFFNLKRVDELLFHHFDCPNWGATDTAIIHFQKCIAELNPSLFVKMIRVTQSFLKSPLRDFYSQFQLSDSLKVHQSVWSYLREQEDKSWQNVTDCFKSLSHENLPVSSLLIELTLLIEFNYCTNRTPQFTDEIAKVYSVFVQLFLSRLIDREIPTPECFLKEFNGRISANIPINESVDRLFGAIKRWWRISESIIIPYCFDLNLDPIEESGVIQFNRSAYDHYKWQLDGLRYDINRVDLIFEGRSLFETDKLSGRYNFKEGINKAGIEYEIKCQIQGHSLQLFLNDLELNEFPGNTKLNSVRFFQPLIAASNMFAWFYDDRLHRTQPHSWTEWIRAFNEMYEKKPSHLGIDNVPYLFLTPKKLYDAHNGQAILEKDYKTKAKALIAPFSYKVVNNPIDRFCLGYDVLKKPFLKLGEFIFCPIHFIAKNDWFYSIAQTSLERMDNDSNKKLRKESSWQMEMKLAEAFQNKNIFVRHFEDTYFSNEEMDVDVLISDDEDVVLMQIKRTKFRFNLKDAYFENVNSDRKASRQLNCAGVFLKDQKDSPTNSKRVHKWIVSTSYENVLSDVDGCLKVNYSDVLMAAKFFGSQSRITTVNDFIEYVKNDFQVRKAIEFVKASNPLEYDLISYVHTRKLRDSFEYTHYLNVLKNSQLGLPLPLENPDNYRQCIKGDAEYDEQYNKAISADITGDKLLAEQLLLECLKLRPKDIDALVALASVLDSLNKTQDAYLFYQKALCLDPDDPFLKRNYIAFLQKYGMNEEADFIIKGLIERYWFVDLELFSKMKDLPLEVKEKIDLITPSEISKIFGF